MKSTFTRLMILVAAVTSIMSLTACGGDDSSSSSDFEIEDTPQATDPNSILYGEWFGTSYSNVMTINFGQNSRGSIKMNSSTMEYSHNCDFTYKYNATYKKISFSFDDGTTADYYCYANEGEGLEYKGGERMILINDYDMKYKMLRGSGGNDSGTSDSDAEPTSTFIVKYVKSTSKYSTSTATYYKKETAGGHIELFSNAACTSSIGYASSNGLSTYGEYNVGRYDYVIRDIGGSSSTYYFFN